MIGSNVLDSAKGSIESSSLYTSEQSDESLMHALTDGAIWAMELLYSRYSALFYSLTYRMVADRQVTEDLVQDAFLVIWRRAASYNMQAGSARSWLLSIMHHRTIDYLRSKRSRSILKEVTLEEGEQLEDATFPDVWEEVCRSLQRSLVHECMAKLLREQRLAIELAYFEGLTQAEIAKKCSIPLGTVKGRVRLGLLHLKRELEKRGMAEA